ncbi:TPA: hypothetical protein JEX09_002248 [Escherichia coli]|nr:hypothetical protein [Escherichia coli]
MKAFNKLFSLVVASVLVFSLAGCGDKEESKKFSANLNGTEIAITYVYKGDKYSAAIFLIPICISFDTDEKRR